MSDEAPSFDFRRKFLKLFGYTIIAVSIGVVIWAVFRLGTELFTEAKHLRCQNNLKSVVEVITLHKARYGDNLPPYLTHLLPLLDDRQDKLICPADPDKGRNGCRPQWMRQTDRKGDFDTANLDGPALDPDKDADSIPCSYLYVANEYPCGLTDYDKVWREVFDEHVTKFGKRVVPLVRCYYHLPKQYVTLDDGSKVPDPAARPTYNITGDLEQRVYPLDWQQKSQDAVDGEETAPPDQ